MSLHEKLRPDHLSEETEPLRLDPGLQTSNVQMLIPAPSLVRRNLFFISQEFYMGRESQCCYVKLEVMKSENRVPCPYQCPRRFKAQ